VITLVVILLLLAAVGVGGFVMWKKNGRLPFGLRLPFMPSRSGLGENLNAEPASDGWRADSRASIGGAE
jgi:hypothetical protein